jgi:hypothetical protein
MQRVVLPWPQPLTQNQVRRLHHYTEAATKKRMHLQAIIANIRTQLAGTTKPRESDLSDEQDPDHTNPHGDPANAPSPPKNHA